MNKDFKKRSDTVLSCLSVLAKADPDIVFIGGSAVQLMLPKAKRFSLDLDVSYQGEVEKLISALEKTEYAVKKRKTMNANFSFYEVWKEKVLVKLDICRFTVPRTKKIKIRDIDCEVLVPNQSYFLAGKLSSLAFKTIGRVYEEPLQVIKDIFDMDSLLETKPDLDEMNADWLQIISDQQKIRGKKFMENACAEDAQRTLLRCVDVKPLNTFYITQGTLGSFEQLLAEGRLLRAGFSSMASRALLLLGTMNNSFYEIEGKAIEESGKRENLEDAETILFKMGVLPVEQLKALKLVAPKSLMYLKYWGERKRWDNPITTQTPGDYNPKYS